jgi:hypothetical protein
MFFGHVAFTEVVPFEEAEAAPCGTVIMSVPVIIKTPAA